jgi:hypothetical protein
MFARRLRFREDKTDTIRSLILEIVRLGVGGAEIVGELGEERVHLARSDFYSCSISLFDAAQPITGALMNFGHIEANAQPTGIATPESRLTASAFNQAQFVAQTLVARPFFRGSGKPVAVLGGEAQIMFEAVKNLCLCELTHKEIFMGVVPHKQ